MHARRVLLSLALAATFGCDDPVAAPAPINAPPTVTITAPAAAVAVEGDSAVVEGVAEDDAGVQLLSYRVNGGTARTVEIVPATRVTFRFVIRGLPVGAVEVEVLAYDAAERSAGAKVSFSRKDLAPVLSVLSPAAGDVVSRDSVRVTGTARDDGEVKAISYLLDGGPEQSIAITPGKEASFGVTLRPTDGEHTLRIRVEDAAGQRADSTIRFTTASWRVVFTSPRADTLLGTFATRVTWRVEPAANIGRVTMSVNGSGESNVCSGSCRFDYPLPPAASPVLADSLSQGRNVITLTAYDIDGRKAATGSLSVNVSVPASRYTLVPLGTLGGSDSQGAELNEKGQVAGWSYDAGGAKRAFVWDGTRMTAIGGLGSESVATAINDDGVVVGHHTADCVRNFRYALGSTAAPSQVLDECGMRAMDVNDAGTVLVANTGTVERAYLVSSAGARPLMLYPDARETVFRVNNREQVLGNNNTGFHGNAARYSASAPPATWVICMAADVNDDGDLASISGCHSSAFGTHGRVAGKVLETIGVGYSVGSYTTNPAGLNNLDQGTGVYLLAGGYGSPRARLGQVFAPFFWDGERMFEVDYGESDWWVDGAVDLNDAGTILGHAVNLKTGAKGAVLLVPRP